MNILMHGSSCEPHFMLIYRTSDDRRFCVIAGAPMSSYLSSRVVMNTRKFFRSYALQSIMIYRFIPYRVTSGGLYEHFDVWQFSVSLTLCSYTVLAMTDVLAS